MLSIGFIKRVVSSRAYRLMHHRRNMTRNKQPKGRRHLSIQIPLVGLPGPSDQWVGDEGREEARNKHDGCQRHLEVMEEYQE